MRARGGSESPKMTSQPAGGVGGGVAPRGSGSEMSKARGRSEGEGDGETEGEIVDVVLFDALAVEETAGEEVALREDD